MAMQEARLMGLSIADDPETTANPPRDATIAASSAYNFRNRSADNRLDWGSSISGSDLDESDGETNHGSNNNNNDNDDLEANGLDDHEIDTLDGKSSTRIGHSSSKRTAASSSARNAAKYPERETGANTGPKGVLADQKYHRQQQIQEQLSTHQAYNARLLAKAPMTTTYREDQKRERADKRAQGLLDDRDSDSDLEGPNTKDEDEKAVLERIRSNRLQEMSWAAKDRANNGADKRGGQGSLLGRKLFGSLMEMNGNQYVDAIDREKKDVTVVIHIYNEHVAASKRLDECLIQLAGRYATTKFIRIKAREVDFDEEVCPTVLVYRAGDLIANLVMITQELSDNFDDPELEELFTKHRVLSPHDKYQRENSYFEHCLDSASLRMSSQMQELNLMSLGDESNGTGYSGLGSSSGPRRGILSGNVPEFRYKDYEDDEDISDRD
ncbi:hypothetical protein BGW38_006085 [Lunasporangiospora selenospora]|uniref:Phosducin domain-containing protein n=1 Tax=Lunasporangiospora selenospora TaxID=979761 RepID=A0A9P6FZ74_9FUNG|nr:hypothetical protein BGW38_006085 [Lunasporangiospora selenospora]